MAELLRRRVMMLGANGGDEPPLYPFPDYSSARVDVHDGNAVSVSTESNTFSYSVLCICPIGGSYVYSNGNSQVVSIANNRPTIFTIPAGANVEVIYDVTEFGGANYWAANFRKANSSTALSYSSGNPATAQKITVRRTTDTDENVGAIYFYLSGVKTDNSVRLEAKISLRVNGVRWI